MAIYLKIPGIQGSVNAAGYEGCIEILNYTVHANRTMTQKPAIAADRTVGPLNFSAITLNKLQDASTASLLQYFYSAKVIPEITVTHVTTGATTLQTRLINTYKQILIGRYSEVHSAHATLEEFEFYFTAHQKSIMTMDAMHTAAAPKIVGFDGAKATSM